MEYEWDPDKAATNLHKHAISFADAVAVFSDQFALTITDDLDGIENAGCFKGALHEEDIVLVIFDQKDRSFVIHFAAGN